MHFSYIDKIVKFNEFKIILPEEINFIKEYYLKVGNISEIVTHINEKRKTEGI